MEARITQELIPIHEESMNPGCSNLEHLLNNQSQITQDNSSPPPQLVPVEDIASSSTAGRLTCDEDEKTNLKLSLQLAIEKHGAEFSTSDPNMVFNFLEHMNRKTGLNMSKDMDSIKKKLEKVHTAYTKLSDMFGPEEDGEPRVIFRKTLTATDKNMNQSRLLIPSSCLVGESFFTNQEIMDMSMGGHVPAKLTDTMGKKHDVCFKIQSCKGQKKQISYVIQKPWCQIAEENGLETGTKIEMFAWRINPTRAVFLRLAIV